MNIIELCLSSGLGGLELYAYHSSNSLKNNHNITAVLQENSKLDSYYKKHSKIDCLHFKRNKNPVPISNAWKLAKFIDNNSIDLIHMHHGKDLALAAFSKFFSKRKPALVYTRHMMITRSKTDFYHNFLYRRVDLMLTITKELESLTRTFIPRSAGKITTLYTGVKQPKQFLDKQAIKSQREKLGYSENDFIVGLIGRLEKNKGQYLLIDAIHLAKQNNYHIKALIVGHEMQQGYREKLKKQAAEHGVLDNVKFHDFVNQPQQLMQLCDCIVLATHRETFGLVLPEAMRSGVAVIGSNNGGVPEIISHEKTGLLFETGNKSSLYQQIERLYLDPTFKGRLARNGKTYADETFNEEKHFKVLDQHFRGSIGINRSAE